MNVIEFFSHLDVIYHGMYSLFKKPLSFLIKEELSFNSVNC